MKTEEIATKYDIDFDEMWMFADQIHEFLGNRPPCGSLGTKKIFPDPKGIGGHCVMSNLELVKEDFSEIYHLIHKINKCCVERHKRR